VYALLSLLGFYVAATATMQLYTLARSWYGLLDAARRVTFDNTRLMWLYTAAQGLLTLALLHGYPRLA